MLSGDEEREFPMTTFKTVYDDSYIPMEIGPKQQAILDNPDFEFAPINRKTISDRLEDARIILNESFATNPQFLTEHPAVCRRCGRPFAYSKSTRRAVPEAGNESESHNE